ncbi:hypothetical protein D9M71_678340 [compost metagenome]
MQRTTGWGEKDCAVTPLEQFHPQRLLQQTHLAAYRAVGDVEQLGGANEAFGLRSNIEIAKGGEGGQFHICEEN